MFYDDAESEREWWVGLDTAHDLCVIAYIVNGFFSPPHPDMRVSLIECD